MPNLDPHPIAERIRTLLGAELEDAGAAARRLGVPEFSLRMCTDDLAPTITLDVLAAVVNVLGVDPSWLLHGMYDSSTHRRAVDGSHRVTPTNILHLVAPASSDPAELADERRLEA